LCSQVRITSPSRKAIVERRRSIIMFYRKGITSKTKKTKNKMQKNKQGDIKFRA
jgi:hypothetical protein